MEYRLWKNGKIPFASHWRFLDPEMSRKRQYIDEAIREIEEESCLRFENITSILMNHMKDHDDVKYHPDFFSFKDPPEKYPDYI